SVPTWALRSDSVGDWNGRAARFAGGAAGAVSAGGGAAGSASCGAGLWVSGAAAAPSAGPALFLSAGAVVLARASVVISLSLAKGLVSARGPAIAADPPDAPLAARWR